MIIVHDESRCTISLFHEEICGSIFEVTYLTEHDAKVMIDFLLLFAQMSLLI
ncbi:hypothetical protein [Enterococcus pallens]|uniref:Uncharacterized protein n=1 Tax=Enterococcus pallens ATCC BAA-351 TaxID=1158607 RepID=R2T3Q2_9ENTE|nr:hypothetical protein [Enterococcus pallens]EOH94859.1 hypothetical protein UAU_01781 [Enterococcus pallens ATCC BAA-351]EOU14822.1 hypothetical protein I588_04472 [Enterococcus pallens ATCC BAA-351]